MSASQLDKATKFRALHGLTAEVGRPSSQLGPTRLGAFIIPNPWDVGSARMLAALGFEALATTSAGFAFTVGRSDGEVKREEALAHCASIAAATALPVSADLENTFGHVPRFVAQTIRLAGATGIVGGSVEDATGNENRPIYDHAHAVERVAAAVEAPRAPRIIFTGATILMTRSGVSRLSLRRAPTYFTRPAFRASKQSAPFAPPLHRNRGK